MLQGHGKHGTERRPDRIVEFTDAWIKTLPEPNSYGDVFWDTVCDRLTVIKAKRGILYRAKLRRAERNAIGLTSNSNLVSLGYDMPVETAREKYRELMKAAEEGRKIFGEESDMVVRRLITPPPSSNPDRTYETLMSVLMDAYAQASAGKGAERHGGDHPFEEQDMQRIIDATSIDFALGQAIKKILEARRHNIRHFNQRAELLGAIVYLAGAIVAADRAAESSPKGVEGTGDARFYRTAAQQITDIEKEAVMQELAGRQHDEKVP